MVRSCGARSLAVLREPAQAAQRWLILGTEDMSPSGVYSFPLLSVSV